MKTYYNNIKKDKSGIYKIINITNNRIYIGSAASFKKRLYHHIHSLRKGTHHNKFLQNDFNKCGEEAFEFHVIQVVDGEQSDRLLVEQTYIDQYFDKQDSCYNFKPQTVAESRSCFSKDPEKTKEKLSKATKNLWKNPEYVQKRIASMKEVANTEEFKEKQRQTTQNYWDSNPDKKKELSLRASKYNKEHPEVVENLLNNQPKGRETFKKRMKEDVELKEKYQKIAKEKVNKLNRRYNSDSEYKEKMDKISSENIRKFNEQKKLAMKSRGSLISPDGIVYNDICCVSDFGKEHNLDISGLLKLFKGKLKSVKGWKLLKN